MKKHLSFTLVCILLLSFAFPVFADVYTWPDSDFQKTKLAFDAADYVTDTVCVKEKMYRADDKKRYTTTAYSYDQDGHLTGVKIVDAVSVEDGVEKSACLYTGKTFKYNSAGNLISKKNYTYAYNAKGLLSKKTEKDDGTTYTTSYVYDSKGRLLQSAHKYGKKAAGTDRFTYNQKGLLTKADYNTMIAEIREVIKGNLGWVLRGLKSVMMDYASRMEFEEAQLVKEKYDLLEEYRSRSTVVSQSIHNVEVFSFIDDDETFYVNYMKVKDGAVVQSHSFEMKRRLEETSEDLLLLAVADLRQQFGDHAPEIIVPMKLDYPIDEVQVTIPQRGDKLKLLDLSRRNALQYKIDLEKQRSLVDPERHQKRVLNSLKEALQLEEAPNVIECFDNSNFQGDYAVAGMVQFVDGKPNKAGYRHFNIKTVEGPDDYASMKEVVRRRYSRLIEEGKPLPNLIITDGGKGQMEVVRQVIEDELHINIPIAGLAKDDRHRTNELLFGFPPQVVGLKPNSEVFRLLAHIQDEVHRFAITFHRKKFEKGFMHSELADIKGVGKKTGEKLLLELKSVKGIKEAKCYINKTTGYPESLRIKVFIFSTTIKITNFQPGNISDDIFVFPEQLYADYTFTEHSVK